MDDDIEIDDKSFPFSVNFPQRKMNDPWEPIDKHNETIPKIPEAPTDPLKDMISSETYIKSLEKKLAKINRKSDVVKPKDMINCLQAVKDLHTSEFMSSQISSEYLDDYNTTSDSHDTVIASLQRKLNPERQALGALELVPLVKDDILSKTVEQSDDST